jgi:hypothetical protein
VASLCLFIPKYFSVFFLRMRVLFYITTIQLSKSKNWTFIQCHQLIHNPNSNCIHSSDNVLYPETPIVFSWDISVVSFKLEQFFILYLYLFFFLL